jgi:CRP/FNR family transcriptional regulator, cyclic AMP receptor protein
MSLQQDVEALRSIPLFAKIEPAKLKLLAFTSERIVYPAGEALFLQGDTADAAYILLDGEAEVVVDASDGPVRVATVGRNHIVGEIAILCDVPRTATVRALSELTTLRIAKDGFFHLVTQFPQVGIEIMAELAERLHRTTQQLTAVSARLREREREGGGT